MPKKRPVELLIETGIIPKEVLEEQIHHRILPQGIANKYGCRQHILKEKSEVDAFVQELAESVDTNESEIRETEFPTGDSVDVWIQWGSKLDSKPLYGRYNAKFGKLFIPFKQLEGMNTAKKISGFSLDGTEVLPVTSKEFRYQGDKPYALVLSTRVV